MSSGSQDRQAYKWFRRHSSAVPLSCLAFLILGGSSTFAGLIGQGATDPLLEAAMTCAAPRQNARPCDVPACFVDYLKETSPAQAAPEVNDTLAVAETACRLTVQQNETARKDAERKASEERILQSARLCMAGATDCVIKSCYNNYMSEFGAKGALRAIALGEIDRAEQRCRSADVPLPKPVTSVADGTYNARSARACGTASQFGIHVAIRAGAISWEHEFRGISYKWSGAVDAGGSVRASVGNSSGFIADGQYSDSTREIQMHYPQCGREAIMLSIIGRL